MVTGGESERIGDIVKQHRARTVFNEQFASGEMLSSLQCGLRSLSTDETEVKAALIGLGDQPQVQAGCVRQICETFHTQPARLIVPSFEMRRGHPWLVERSLWSELLELMPPQSPRDFLNLHAAEILYVEMDTAEHPRRPGYPAGLPESRPQFMINSFAIPSNEKHNMMYKIVAFSSNLEPISCVASMRRISIRYPCGDP